MQSTNVEKYAPKYLTENHISSKFGSNYSTPSLKVVVVNEIGSYHEKNGNEVMHTGHINCRQNINACNAGDETHPTSSHASPNKAMYKFTKLPIIGKEN